MTTTTTVTLLFLPCSCACFWINGSIRKAKLLTFERERERELCEDPPPSHCAQLLLIFTRKTSMAQVASGHAFKQLPEQPLWALHGPGLSTGTYSRQ